VGAPTTVELPDPTAVSPVDPMRGAGSLPTVPEEMPTTGPAAGDPAPTSGGDPAGRIASGMGCGPPATTVAILVSPSAANSAGAEAAVAGAAARLDDVADLVSCVPPPAPEERPPDSCREARAGSAGGMACQPATGFEAARPRPTVVGAACEWGRKGVFES
jgi:hypothetical protein